MASPFGHDALDWPGPNQTSSYDAYTQFRMMSELLNYQLQAQQQARNNLNQMGQTQNQVAGLGYNLYGDLNNQMLRAAGMQSDLLRQQRSDTQYQRGLQEDVARTQHQQSVNEVPTAFGMSKRLLGY